MGQRSVLVKYPRVKDTHNHLVHADKEPLKDEKAARHGTLQGEWRMQ